MFWKVARRAPVSVAVYPFAFLLSWLMVGVAYGLSWLVALISVVRGTKDVGGPLSYLYTHNASLDGGVEQGVSGYLPNLTGFRLWWQRTCWVCRNPAYKFNAYILGFDDEGAVVIFDNGIIHRNKPFGYWYVVEAKGGRRFFGYRGERAWIGWNYREYGGRHQIKCKPF